VEAARVTDPDRQRLAAALRALRIDADFTQAQLAELLAWSQSKVTKVERGATLPQPGDVNLWTMICGADSEQRDEVIALAERLSTQMDSWRAAVAPGRVKLQQEVAARERAASVIRVWQPNIIPGLLQAPEYAEWVFRLGRKGAGPDETLDELVAARLARQAVLDDLGKRFEFVVGAAALNRMAFADFYEAQYERLNRDAERPNVELAFVYFEAEETVHQYHGYSILGDPGVDDDVVVSAETITRPLTLRKAWEVADYLAHFDAVKAASSPWLPDS
jgi:transcriptional regulator with XRE-family HTH domain